MKRSGILLSIACLLATSAAAQTPARTARAPARSKAAVAVGDTTKPKLKAIWEPVNYPQDAELTDVFFVSAEVGWVTGLKRTDGGEGGFIIHTTDGGEHWNLQLGDPHSANRALTNLFFLDPTHGWAGQFGGQLMRTADGENWESAATFATLTPYQFTSPTTGFSIINSELRRSNDGGHSWKPILNCQVHVEVDGLQRDVNCNFVSLRFATPEVGYVTSDRLPNNTGAVFKTQDGGTTWKQISFLPTAARESSIGFADANTGFVKVEGEKLMGTFDGGQTWRGLPVTVPGGRPPIRFADHEVGWIVEGTTFAYTNNGGKRWNAVEIRLPARINTFALPRRDRGYVIGDHGMIYRYRIVPIDYTSKGMIAAPVM